MIRLCLSANFHFTSAIRVRIKFSYGKEIGCRTFSTGNNEVPFPSDDDDYRSNMAWTRDQRKHSYRPSIDPRQTSIFLFPGQGTQFVGMGKNLIDYPGVKDMYAVASEKLGYNLLDLCLKGPQQKLDRTVYSQTAIFVSSVAAVERLKHQNPKAIEECITTAGYSIGEYAALVFADAMDFDDALDVVNVRAKAMQNASDITPSGMLSVTLKANHKLKYGCELARQFCEEQLQIENPVCTIASHTYTEAKVIAGHEAALKFIESNSSDLGITSCKHINVSGAFHTKLMAPACKPLNNILNKIKLRKPIVNVHSNVTGHKYGNSTAMARLLEDQVTAPVKWEQLMHSILTRSEGEEFPNIYEVGPGKQLGYFLRGTNRKAFKRYQSVDV